MLLGLGVWQAFIYTLCYFENDPESLDLKELLKLGLSVTRQKPWKI